MERQRADSVWAEGNPKMRAANNNLEHMFKFQEVGGGGLSGVGGRRKQMFVGLVVSHRKEESLILLGNANACSSGRMACELCLYALKILI